MGVSTKTVLSTSTSPIQASQECRVIGLTLLIAKGKKCNRTVKHVCRKLHLDSHCSSPQHTNTLALTHVQFITFMKAFQHTVAVSILPAANYYTILLVQALSTIPTQGQGHEQSHPGHTRWNVNRKPLIHGLDLHSVCNKITLKELRRRATFLLNGFEKKKQLDTEKSFQCTGTALHLHCFK